MYISLSIFLYASAVSERQLAVSGNALNHMAIGTGRKEATYLLLGS